MKEREEFVNTLRTSENQAESVSFSANIKLREAQDLFAQDKLIRSGADRDLVQAMKSVQDLQAKPTASQNQFHAFYDAVTPILASICHREDRELGLGGLIPLIPSLFMIL